MAALWGKSTVVQDESSSFEMSPIGAASASSRWNFQPTLRELSRVENGSRWLIAAYGDAGREAEYGGYQPDRLCRLKKFHHELRGSTFNTRRTEGILQRTFCANQTISRIRG